MYKKYTMQILLDDFDIIKLYQQSGKAHHFSKMTKKQVALYEAIRVQIPTYYIYNYGTSGYKQASWHGHRYQKIRLCLFLLDG